MLLLAPRVLAGTVCACWQRILLLDKLIRRAFRQGEHFNGEHYGSIDCIWLIYGKGTTSLVVVLREKVV